MTSSKLNQTPFMESETFDQSDFNKPQRAFMQCLLYKLRQTEGIYFKYYLPKYLLQGNGILMTNYMKHGTYSVCEVNVSSWFGTANIWSLEGNTPSDLTYR
uniref:Uncharacterized protein n=1 Tax=Cacopsylla melanoneura TaxID=428564 RepID=A0A8D8SUC5_9HEMI